MSADRTRLLAVARGDAEPDLVVTGGRVFSAFTREWLDGDVAIAERRGLELERAEIVADVPVACDPDVIDAAARAAEALGLPYRRMTSGAYHDAMIMGARVPIGMIFVPSRGGVSHHPDEFTAPEELERGVQVLAGTLSRLAA